MRLAILAHSFPRFPGDTHGPFVEALALATARLGHEVDVLVPFDCELRETGREPLRLRSFRYVVPDSLHRLGYSRTLKRDIGMHFLAYLESPLYFAFAEQALTRLVRERRIDLVHAHWVLPNGFVAARVCKKLGLPLAITLHGSDVFMAERNRVFGAMARFAVEQAAHITSCSADLRDRLLAIAGQPHASKILLVPNGTELGGGAGDTAAANELKSRFELGRWRHLVVAVGRLVDKKGFRYLLEAAPAILAADKDVAIVIGGGGDLLATLRRQAEALGVADRVIFTDTLNHQEVLALIGQATVFVMPSVRDVGGNIDGLPIVVLEAMAAGVPVVASNVAGMPLAIRDGESGRLVPEKDAEALAAAVTALLAEPSAVRALGEAGGERVRTELNWDAVATRHDALYRAAAAQR